MDWFLMAILAGIILPIAWIIYIVYRDRGDD